VLLAIDLTAGAVELMVKPSFFLAGELAAIRGAIGVILLVDALLAILGPCGFAGGHLAAANALRDAIPLVLAALADLVVAIVSHVGIVLVSVDRLAQIVLLVVDLLVLLRSELAIVGGAIVADLAIQICLAAFKVLGFTRVQLT